MHVHHVLEYVHSSCKLRARLTVLLRILTMHNTTELLSREYVVCIHSSTFVAMD